MIEKEQEGNRGPTVAIQYDNDNPALASRVKIELDLEYFADSKDFGTALLRGVLEERKAEFLLVIKKIRERKASKLITPETLKVH